RPFLVPGDLGLLPRRESGVEFGERLLGFRLELGDLLRDRWRIALLRHRSQRVYAGVDVGDRRFETEITAHSNLAASRTGPRRRGKLAAGGRRVKFMWS